MSTPCRADHRLEAALAGIPNIWLLLILCALLSESGTTELLEETTAVHLVLKVDHSADDFTVFVLDLFHVVLDQFQLSLKVVFHILVALLDFFYSLSGRHIAESGIIGSHNLPNVIKLVIEKLVCLSDSCTQLFEGLFETLNVLLVVVVYLVFDFLIERV